MVKVESLPKAKNMIPSDAAQNQPFFDSASILQSNRKSLGLVSLWMLPKMSGKYRLYRFCDMCPEWLCGLFQKMQFRNLEIMDLSKKKSTLSGALSESLQSNGQALVL